MKKIIRNNWGWIIIILLLAVTLQAQSQNFITLKLENEPLPTALKLIEREGGKNVIFSVTETEKYYVSVDIQQKTQAEAIGIILQGTPFIHKERTDYFVIQKNTQKKVTEIRGMVMNEKNEPMPYCNVLLLVSDSTFVNGCVTKNDGTFLMIGEEDVPYSLRASYVGYTTTTQAISDKNKIQLFPDLNILEEVTITAEHPLIEPNANGLKVNVIGTSLAKMGTANEMLKHIPFVTSHNGNYSVLGHGTPEIYINNRKLRDMGELDRLRADEIVSAEVITIPGAEYAANIPAVIRIRTIKQRGQGWSGSLLAQYTQGNLANGYGMISLNYRIGGLDIFGSGYLTRVTQYGNSTAEDHLEASSIWETYTQKYYNQKQDYFFGTFGFNYDFNERHSFGLRYEPNTPFGNYKIPVHSDVSVKKDGDDIEQMNTEQVFQNKTRWKHSVNAYYTGNIGKWQVDVNVDYLFGQSETLQEISNNSEKVAESTSKVRNYLYAVKATAGIPIAKGHFSIGTEETFTNRHDLFLQSGFSADANNKVKQSLWSVFANYSLPLGKWNLSAGFRYEHQQTDYYENNIYKEEQSPTYNDFIPTVSANYRNGDWSLTLSYKNYRENVPYNILTNAINYRSKYEYMTGNPLLPKQTSDRLSLDTSWKWIYMNVWYQHVKNSYITVTKAYNDKTHPGVRIIDYQAIPQSKSYGSAISLAPKIGIWQPQATINLSFWDSDLEVIGINYDWNEPYWFFVLDNNFTLPKGWFVNVQGTFVPKFKQGSADKKAMGMVNLRLSKSFLKDNTLNVTLIANDIFHTQHNAMTAYSIGTSTSFTEYYDHQRIGIQLSYKFNATKSKYKGTGAGQSEKNRL